MKVTPKQLRQLIESIIDEQSLAEKTWNVRRKKKAEKKAEPEEPKEEKKKIEEKLIKGSLGTRNPHGKMSFDMWEAGAATDDPEIVEHMREQHAGEMKSELEWSRLYDTYCDAMGM